MKIFISGSSTGVGKTYISLQIANRLRKKNLKIISAKPIETGVLNEPLDAKKHALKNKCSISDICFYQFLLPSAPFVADSKNIIDINFIKQILNELEKSCDILLIEGAGGLFVPIKKDYFMLDLIQDLNAFCLLVCGGKLGCINEILSAQYILKNHNIHFKTIINLRKNDKDFSQISKPFIDLLDDIFILPSDLMRLESFLIQHFKSQHLSLK